MNPSGMIGSPDRGGGGENNVNINCVWAIIAPDGYRIQIDFVKIDIPLGAHAFVQVRSCSSSSEQVNQFCLTYDEL